MCFITQLLLSHPFLFTHSYLFFMNTSEMLFPCSICSCYRIARGGGGGGGRSYLVPYTHVDCFFIYLYQIVRYYYLL